MNATRKWTLVDSDEAFREFFTNAQIVEATTTGPDDASYLSADIFWRFSDGRWLAMEVSTASGCPTCGYGAGDKTYYTLEP